MDSWADCAFPAHQQRMQSQVLQGIPGFCRSFFKLKSGYPSSGLHPTLLGFDISILDYLNPNPHPAGSRKSGRLQGDGRFRRIQ